MFEDVKLAWKLWSLWDLLKGGSMGVKDILNLGISSLLVGFGTMWSVHLACTDPSGGCWMAGLGAGATAAVGALIQQLRGSPLTKQPLA